PLRGTVAATAGDLGAEAERLFPLPTDADPVRRIERALSLLADRDLRRAYVHTVVARADVAMSPAAAWLLVRASEGRPLDVAELARSHRLDAERLARALRELLRGGWLTAPEGPSG